MTRKRFIKLLMGRHNISRNETDFIAHMTRKLYRSYAIGYQKVGYIEEFGRDISKTLLDLLTAKHTYRTCVKGIFPLDPDYRPYIVRTIPYGIPMCTAPAVIPKVFEAGSWEE